MGLKLFPNSLSLYSTLGGTSALGIASTLMAKALGVRVISTTNDENRVEFLKSIGVDKIIVDKNNFKEQMDENVDKILELVGPRTLEESMSFLNHHGIVCNTGVLGGVYSFAKFDPIKQIPNSVYLTSFYSNIPTQKEIDDMFNFLNKYNIKPIIGKIYDFESIQEAHKDLENGNTKGKGIVAVSKEAKILLNKE